MRTLPGDFSTASQAPVTRPIHFASIGWGTPIYISSGEEVTYDGDTYTESSCSVSGLDSDNPTLVLPNASGTYSTIVFQEGTVGIDVQIYMVYSTASGQTNVLQRFDGELSHADPITGSLVTLHLSRYFSRRRTAPRIEIGPPHCNHVRPGMD